MKYLIILLTSLFLVSNASAKDANKITALEIIENGRYVGEQNKTDEYIIFAKKGKGGHQQSPQPVHKS